MKSVIADNVKRIIKNRCMKQGLVAERAGYKPQAFSNMLNGRKIVTDVDVARIANVLEVSVNELFMKPNTQSDKKAG